LTPHYRSLIKRMLLLFALLWLTMVFVGCNFFAWGAQAFRDDEKPVPVEAQYTQLGQRRVAVLVSADDQTLFRFPRSTFRIAEAVSRGIATHVEGATVSLPGEVDQFQRNNPYWITTRPGRLIDQLGVDRLVVIDLSEYRTNDPGNANVWRGVIEGVVSVYQADGEDPDNRSFEQTVRAEYPRDSQFGKIKDHATQESIEAATLSLFALRAGGLFYDYEEVRP
jgi:hypothetical protein